MELIKGPMWEDVIAKMTYSEIKNLISTSKEVREQVELLPRWRQAKKLFWFLERIKKVTDFDLSMLKWKKSKDWTNFEIQLEDNVYLSWSRVLKKYCLTQFNGERYRPMPKNLSRDQLIDFLVPIYKTMMLEEKKSLETRKPPSKYLMIGDYRMSMKKSHDLWFWRQKSFHIKLTKDLCDLLELDFEPNGLELNFDSDWVYVCARYSILKKIKLDWPLFKAILSKDSDGTTRIFYGEEEISYWDAEWLKIHQLHFHS